MDCKLSGCLYELRMWDQSVETLSVCPNGSDLEVETEEELDWQLEKTPSNHLFARHHNETDHSI